MTDGHAGDGAPAAQTASSPRGARTAAKLRQAALQAFSELGWQATRVEDIVRRAGVSHGTFYTYYENRSAVLLDLVQSSQADVAALAREPWESNNVRGALERVIGGFLDLYRRDAIIMRTWLHAARDDREFAHLYRRSRSLFVQRVADNVASAVAASGREGPPAETVASTLVSMVEHFCYCWVVLDEAHERDDALDALVLVWGSTLNALCGFELVHLD